MAIKISSALKKKLPPDQVQGLEDFLWSKYKKCHLCSKSFNRTTDLIEADHDDPTAEGGAQSRENLWLAHKKCNAFKKNFPSILVRPFLEFEAFLESKPVNIKYGECLEHFSIKPVSLYGEKQKNKFTVHLPTNEIVTLTPFEEKVRNKKFEYAYVELPKNSIFNDEECQPRVIKIKQVWAIFNDLHINPLYEAPGCRLESSDDGNYKILMFDGQHKTIANWLLDRKTIVVKLYMNMNRTEANQLVNSIQSRIQKLPLSALEQAVKLSDEWKDLFQNYEQESGEKASEAGFIKFVQASQRLRATAALKASFIDRLIKNEDLLILEYVEGISRLEENMKFLIKETTIKTKVFDKLIFSKPLSTSGQDGADLRDREQKNIIRLLNLFVNEAWEPKGGKRSELEELRLGRMKYQASLQYISEVLKKTVRHICAIDSDERALMDKEISEPNWIKISNAIKNLIDHPIWSCDFELSKKVKFLGDAISGNQNIDEAFKGIGLTVGYLVDADPLSATWYN